MNTIKINELAEAVVESACNVTENRIYKIYLYGSYARGDFDNESDVDIMLVLDCDKNDIDKYRKRMCRYASRLSMQYDKEISILIRDKDDFYNNQDIVPFYHNVIKEGIVLYGE